MLKFFADLTNQCFAVSLRDRSVPYQALTQDSQEPVEIYLVRPTFDNRWPFQIDPLSGSALLESPVVTLCNPGSLSAPTLTSPALLTPIRNGFTGTLDLATTEIAAFLGNLPERQAILSIDAVKDTLQRTLFRAPLFVRPHAIVGAPATSYELSGAGNPVAISATGVTDLAPAADFLQWFQLVNVTPGGAAFTHKLTLDSARALPGATFALQVNIPAGAHPPTIEIYDNGVSGSPLDSITGDTDNDVAYRFEAVLRPDRSWMKDNSQYL